MQGWQRALGGAAVLVVVGIVAYHDLGSHEFINYDDQDYITENRDLDAGLSWTGIRWAFSGYHAYNYHPVTWLTHLADYQLFGRGPAGHHWMSLAWHLATAVLLFFTLARGTGAPAPSWLVAAWFLLHPTAVESVAWAAERKNLVSTFFWVATMAAYQAYAARPAVGRYAATLGLLCCGLLSKQMLVTLPLVLWLWDYWPLGRFDAALASGSPAQVFRRGGQLLLEKLPLLAASAVASWLVLAAQGHRSVGGEGLPLVERLGHAVIVTVDYLASLFWPIGLGVFYPYNIDRVTVPRVVFCLGILALITLAALAAGRRRGFLPVGWFWFLGTLVPIIGLVQVGLQDRADRYLYVPGIGIFLAVAFALHTIEVPAWPRQVVFRTVGVLSLAICLALTWRQNGFWRNTQSLFEHTLAVTGPNGIAHHLLGEVYLRQGELKQAFDHLQRAATLHASQPRPNISFARLLMQMGRYPEAVTFYDRALAANASASFAFVYLERGQAYLRQGKPAEAAADFERLLAISPNEPAVVCSLGMARWIEHRDAEATALFERALELKPDFGPAHYQLAEMARGQGRTAEAVDHFRRAWRADPTILAAGNGLAWLLATSNDPAIRAPGEAVEVAEAVCRSAPPEEASYADTLAVAYAAAGRRTEALAAARRALAAAQRRGDNRSAATYAARLAAIEQLPVAESSGAESAVSHESGPAGPESNESPAGVEVPESR